MLNENDECSFSEESDVDVKQKEEVEAKQGDLRYVDFT